jgi:hypothetical protein
MAPSSEVPQPHLFVVARRSHCPRVCWMNVTEVTGAPCALSGGPRGVVLPGSVRSQGVTRPSSAAAARVLPSGLNVTELTACPWDATSAPWGIGVWAASSHIVTVAVPAIATNTLPTDDLLTLDRQSARAHRRGLSSRHRHRVMKAHNGRRNSGGCAGTESSARDLSRIVPLGPCRDPVVDCQFDRQII